MVKVNLYCDYIAIITGYTERLFDEEYTANIKKLENHNMNWPEEKVLLLRGETPDQLKFYTDDKEERSELAEINTKMWAGGFVFPGDETINVLYMIHELIDFVYGLDFCAGGGIVDNPDIITLPCGKTVMIIELDTESG